MENLSKEKQTEFERNEIAEIISQNFRLNDEQYDPSDFEWSAHCVQCAGYRKANDLAEEIFAEIEKIINEPFAVGFELGVPLKKAIGDYNNGIREYILYYVAELKKKYTESEKDNG